jgi:hypothetical protein
VRPEAVQTALRIALTHSGVSKRITPHTLRHYAESRIMPTRFCNGLEVTADSDHSAFQKSA